MSYPPSPFFYSKSGLNRKKIGTRSFLSVYLTSIHFPIGGSFSNSFLNS